MPSIRQLAKLAGVSIFTVSRALSGGAGVSEETRKRIIELAELYQYRPNRLSHNALSGKSGLIGYIVPDVTPQFLSNVLKGIIDEGYNHGYQVFVLETHGDFVHTCKALETMVDLRVEGVVLQTGPLMTVTRESIVQLWSHDIPAVLVDSAQADAALDHVRTCEAELGETIVEYLFSLGHRQMFYVGMCDNPTRNTSIIESMCTHHLAGQQHCLIEYPTLENIEYAAKQFLSLPTLPTAIITHDDTFSAMLVQLLVRYGYRVPQNFSVLGIGNLSLCPFILPALSTVEQHPIDIGKEAARMLLSRITSKHYSSATDAAVRHISHRIIERDSCARPYQG